MTLLLHNDGTEFFCDQCKVTIQRTRDNPFPEHTCSLKPVLDLREIERCYGHLLYVRDLLDFIQVLVEKLHKAEYCSCGRKLYGRGCNICDNDD